MNQSAASKKPSKCYKPFVKFAFSILFSVLFPVSCFLFSSPAVFAAEDINPVRSQTLAQKILELRKQVEELTQQAELYKKNIFQKQKEADTLKRQIDILNNQILRLQTQIAVTERQIGTAKIEILDLEGRIFDTQNDINRKKETIGSLLSLVYERDKLSLTAILLKNPRLSDFADQAQQEQNLNQRLIALLVSLKDEKEKLQDAKSELEAKKKELENLNAKQVNQKIAVTETKGGKDRLLSQTRGKEKEYQRLLNEVEKKKAEFFAELQKLEAEAVKSGAFIVRVTASSVPPKGSKIFQWPEDDYVLTQGYGYTPYAKRGVYGGAPHNGIDFSSGYGTSIKPVARGVILASGFNNGWGNWVAARHDGGLVSVYAHLRSPSGLANGTPVGLNSIIGYEGSTGNSTGPHLHLSVYRDFFTYINPKNGQLYFNYFDGSLNPLDYL